MEGRQDNTVAYSICYFSNEISISLTFFMTQNITTATCQLRLVLQTVIDSHDRGLKYCYLGRFSQDTGFYKRNMPGFEYFENNNWISYQKLTIPRPVKGEVR